VLWSASDSSCLSNLWNNGTASDTRMTGRATIRRACKEMPGSPLVSVRVHRQHPPHRRHTDHGDVASEYSQAALTRPVARYRVVGAVHRLQPRLVPTLAHMILTLVPILIPNSVPPWVVRRQMAPPAPTVSLAPSQPCTRLSWSG